MTKIISALCVLLVLGCEPFVTEFSDSSDAIMYEANHKTSTSYNGGVFTVVTWNIRFGIARFPFFGDSCGDGVVLDDDAIEKNMAAIADSLNRMNADIVLLQEVDVSSKRTGYLNQVQYLLDNTNLNYACYASMWKADFIPSDGIGRIDAGNAILSKYELTDAERIQLRLRTDQDGLTQYFYLRRNLVKAKIPALSQGEKNLFAVNIHATAFATDDTKQKHIDTYLETLSEIHTSGNIFVTGGDLNSVPPGSITDFCLSDMCEDEDYHTQSAEEYHKEGSYFENFDGEPDILTPLYDSYAAAISSVDANLTVHFTHGPSSSYEINNIKYDRKLDYLFTNHQWVDGLSQTHQGAWELSDHLPVSAVFSVEGIR
ncbi:MAG: hypothetical protein HN674_04170 [Candidatus Marinimicrobia bacterium]|jgi:endonuclease/exonuclease/phosphatase family metal-dependent hydrolase|nr:hypothetical protein [Candidatus Neomarinimicrobiota bacterium]